MPGATIVRQNLAWDVLDTLSQTNSLSALVRSIRGELLIQEGRFDEALQEFDQAVQLAPNSGEYYLARAWGSLHKRDFDRVAQDLLRARQFLEDEPVCRRVATSLLIAQGERVQAKNIVAKLIESSYQSVFCQFKQALFMLWDGQVDDGIDLYKETVAIAENDELMIALLDLDLISDLSYELRQQARTIVQERYKPGLGILDLDIDLSTFGTIQL